MLALRRSIPLGLLLALVACDEASGESASSDVGETEDTGEGTMVGVSPATVTWVLDWSSNELELVNDLGYLIHVDAGWIGTWGATLVECTSADASGSMRVSTGSLELARPGRVAQGHSTGEDDPSAWVYAGVESLTERATIVAEPRTLAGGRYCQAHCLFAPISETNVEFAAYEAELTELDPEQTLSGATLLVFGRWQAPGGGAETPFVLRSEQSYGKILELELSDGVEGLDDTDVDLVFERDLATMFTGVEFATTTPEDAAWQVLGNLAKQARVHAR